MVVDGGAIMIKACLLGLGRTGTIVAEHLIESPGFDLVAVFTKPKGVKANRKLNELINKDTKLIIKDATNLASEIQRQKIQVAIDFTNPKAVLKNARVLAEKGVHLVIGTTGFNKVQLNELKNIADQYKIGLVYAPNISVGINILMVIVKTLAKLLPSYDVEISEYHHRYKKDAPSGTAVKIAAAVNNVKQNKEPRLVFGRFGPTARSNNEIGIHAIRAGGIIGVHKVLFSGNYDEIEVTHRSYSRSVFAEGALKASKFIANKSGFYNMEDVLMMEDQTKNKIQTISTNFAEWWSLIFNWPTRLRLEKQ